MNSTAFSLLANSSSELDGSQEIELTIRSLSIFIGPSGSSRLSDSTKPDPSASKPETEETLKSSKGSSSEVNSLISLEKAPIAEGDKVRENFNSGERACQTHSNARDFAVGSSGVSKVYQLRVIITEAEEENNNEGSKKVDDHSKIYTYI
jgi:tryptophanyl-tRNA synthetase